MTAHPGSAADGLLLAGGTVLDGTGAPGVVADVLIRDGRIAAIGADLPGERLDVTGRVVCPGFVDIHTHSDLTLLANPGAPSKIQQGVTTEVVGNCGLGVAPLATGADRGLIRAAVSYLDLDPDVAWDWTDTAGYLAAVRTARTSVNVATLVPHLVLHAGAVGFGDAPADTAQLDTMCGLLGDALDDGALGLSTGLVYAPLTFAADGELTALASVVAERDAVFTWHVRNYDDDLLPSVRQALDVARRTGCRTQISHLAAVGRRNWGAVEQALDLVDTACADGLRIGVDVYPYLHGNAPLSQLLPAWAQEGGADAMRTTVAEHDARVRIRAGWADRPTSWDDITVSWTGHDDDPVLGRTITEAAAERGCTGDDLALDLLAERGTGVLVVAGGRSEDDLRTILRHPRTVVASDGLSLDPSGVTGSGVPHPRSYGCFPRYLAHYAADDPSGLPGAIARCTSAPARLLGLTDRGVLHAGAAADVVVFDPAGIADTATFSDPQQFPTGLELVVVNGDVVVDGGRHTGARPGRVLTRNRKETS